MFIPFALLNSFFILIASLIAAAALAWAFRLPTATMIIATSPARDDDNGASAADHCPLAGLPFTYFAW
jgi:hypothetical protein